MGNKLVPIFTSRVLICRDKLQTEGSAARSGPRVQKRACTHLHQHCPHLQGADVLRLRRKDVTAHSSCGRQLAGHHPAGVHHHQHSHLQGTTGLALVLRFVLNRLHLEADIC